MFSFCIVIMPLLCMVFAPLKEVGIFLQNSSPCNLSSFFPQLAFKTKKIFSSYSLKLETLLLC